MARGRIPESFIQDLLARTDIVPVITARVPLKRAGREYHACCPFHAENTPSFTVSPQKQFYHCFGCGAHGTAVGFLMEFEGMEFVDAVEELASLAGLEVPREAGRGPARADDIDALYAILAEAEAFYRSALKQDSEAIAYLRERGLSGDMAAQFRLGVAPAAWRALTEALGGSAERLKLLERAGLVSPRQDGTAYDRFRGRVIFPIHDTRGRPIAFGGRVFGDHEGPKYLNSPETELFHKGRQLYGLHEARQTVGRPDRLIVVEGYMDVLALAQHGVPEAVATLGTATTPEHARLLFRTAGEIIFCFDGDRAGRQAAERAMEAIIPEMHEGRQARFLFLPDGEDPDSLIRGEGSEGFRDRMAHATPFSEFFFARHQADFDMHSMDGRAAFVAACRPGVERMPEGALRGMMFERMGELARSSVAVVGSTPQSSRATRPARPRPAREQMTPVRRAICLLLQAPKAAGEVAMAEVVRELDRPGMGLLTALHDWCAANPAANTAQVLHAFGEHEFAGALARLATWDLGLTPEQAAVEYGESLAMFERRARPRIDPGELERAIAARQLQAREPATAAEDPAPPRNSAGATDRPASTSPVASAPDDPGPVPDDETDARSDDAAPWFRADDPGPDPDDHLDDHRDPWDVAPPQDPR